MPSLVSIHHVAAVEGFVSQLKPGVVKFFRSTLLVDPILLDLRKLAGCVCTGQRVDVRRESYVKSMALLPHDVTILTCIALHLLTGLHAVESLGRTW